jgi:hypothetical protein
LAQDFVEARKAGRIGEGSKARWARMQAERQQAEQTAAKPLEHSRTS